jgi:hypothetical protein
MQGNGIIIYSSVHTQEEINGVNLGTLAIDLSWKKLMVSQQSVS